MARGAKQSQIRELGLPGEGAVVEPLPHRCDGEQCAAASGCMSSTFREEGFVTTTTQLTITLLKVDQYGEHWR